MFYGHKISVWFEPRGWLADKRQFLIQGYKNIDMFYTKGKYKCGFQIHLAPMIQLYLYKLEFKNIVLVDSTWSIFWPIQLSSHLCVLKRVKKYQISFGSSWYYGCNDVKRHKKTGNVFSQDNVIFFEKKN